MNGLSTSSLVHALDAKDMRNKEHYKRTISIAQRIHFKIIKLKDDRKNYRQCKLVAAKDSHTSDDQENIQSPTETIIACYDDNQPAYDRGKPLPLVKHTSVSRKPLLPLYVYTSFDSAVELSALPNTKKPLPPIVSSPFTWTPSYCTSSSSSSTTATVIATPLIPPAPPLDSSSSPPHTTKTNQLPTVQHVQKRYNGVFGFLTRSYILHTIIVSRTLLSPYLYASRDMITGEKKAVLKLIVMCSHQHGFQITFPPYKKQHRNSSSKYSINDNLLVFYLVQWIKYQPLLPLLVHAKNIFRDGHKLYIVYNHQLLE